MIALEPFVTRKSLTIIIIIWEQIGFLLINLIIRNIGKEVQKAGLIGSRMKMETSWKCEPEAWFVIKKQD